MAWLGSAQAVILFFCSLFRPHHCCTNQPLSCTSQRSTVRCHEDARCLKLHWTEMIPYAYLNATDPTTPHGILIEVTKSLLDRCCGTCWALNTTAPVDFMDFYRTEPEDAGLTLPSIMSAVDYTYLENYVPIIKDPTSAYIKKMEGWKTLMRNLMSTIYDAWPVLITALLFSWLSGMIIWLLELWFNDEQFPRRFLRGSWEGFWWAFVSMTTVGYGDRAPRTFLGRVFAIFWIMIGICICSIFTATLTSALTMNVYEGQKTSTRTEVGVMANSMEAITAVQNQADVHYYNSSEDVWDAVLYGEVDGILLDYYYAMAHEEELAADKLLIVNVFKPKDWSFGVNLISKDLAKCMRDEYTKDYAKILYDAITSEDISEPTKIKFSTQISGIFDPHGSLFRSILLCATSGALFIFIIGLGWDCFCRGKKIDCLKSAKVGKVENAENELVSELHAVFVNWQERMAETKGSFALQTTDSKV